MGNRIILRLENTTIIEVPFLMQPDPNCVLPCYLTPSGLALQNRCNAGKPELAVAQMSFQSNIGPTLFWAAFSSFYKKTLLWNVYLLIVAFRYLDMVWLNFCSLNIILLLVLLKGYSTYREGPIEHTLFQCHGTQCTTKR